MSLDVYLDWNASMPLDEDAREAMLPWLGERFGNASSLHTAGRQARLAVEMAREQVARAVGAQPSEVIFTSGGSEANNLLIKGLAAAGKPGLIVVSAGEHPCVLAPARQLTRQGWRLVEVPLLTSGELDHTAWQAALVEGAVVASVMVANNETGVINDFVRLAEEARAAGVLFHCDAVQAFGKISLDFRASGVSAMTLSAHKLGGPLGAGALLLDKRVELAPLIAGGGQERGMRSGTENVAAIVGFGVAAQKAAAQQAAEALRLVTLRDQLEARLVAAGATVFGRAAVRLPNTVYFAFAGIDGDTLVGKLDQEGFACGSGSACSSASSGPSHVLLAMGVSPDLAQGAVRVSMGVATRQADIDLFAANVIKIIDSLNRLAAVSTRAGIV